MPAVQLGAFVISTDTPLVAVPQRRAAWPMWRCRRRRGGRWLARRRRLGLALGLAFLAKYAALYAVVGVALHLALSRDARRAWTPAAARWSRSGLFAALAAPNVVWNAANGYAAVGNVASEAAWGARKGGLVRGRELPGQPVRRLRAGPVRGADRRRRLARLAPAADPRGRAAAGLGAAGAGDRAGPGPHRRGKRQLGGRRLSRRPRSWWPPGCCAGAGRGC